MPKKIMCYILYKHYMLCELSTKKMKDCDKEFKVWNDNCNNLE